MLLPSLLVLFFPSVLLSERIPTEMRKALRRAHTLHALFDHPDFTFQYHPNENHRHRNPHNRNNNDESPPVVLAGGRSRNRNRNSSPQTAADTTGGTGDNGVKVLEMQENYEIHSVDDVADSHLSMLKDYSQGNDTCSLQSICVPIPNQHDDPDIISYPRCYQLQRCIGSCCESSETCHPLRVRQVIRPIVQFVYQGNGRFLLNKTLNITMEEHEACSCADCGRNVPNCAFGYTISRDCTCECVNKEQCEDGHERRHSHSHPHSHNKHQHRHRRNSKHVHN